MTPPLFERGIGVVLSLSYVNLIFTSNRCEPKNDEGLLSFVKDGFAKSQL